MPPYKVRFARRADKELAALQRDLQERIVHAADALALDPRPASCRKLAGMEDTYRIRVGDYRVLYEIHDNQLLVLVVRVAHRREAYR